MLESNFGGMEVDENRVRIERFTVQNFKNFAGRFTLDFTNVGKYDFHADCIADDLVKNAVIYGKNAVGKTNFGMAVMDLTYHLIDKTRNPGVGFFYLNADHPEQPAFFCYEFALFDGADVHHVTYRYHKFSPTRLKDEELQYDGARVFYYDFENAVRSDVSSLRAFGIDTLNWAFHDENLSILRYIANNMALPADHFVMKLMRFINGMLWFCSLGDGNNYVGLSTGVENMMDFISQNGYREDFQSFLQRNGIEETLVDAIGPDGRPTLAFRHKMLLPVVLSSSGTKALTTLYYWEKQKTHPTFLFIDEFDAFYHFELAEKVVEALIHDPYHIQSVVTTHNTALLTNRLMRPDCYFILTKEKLVSLPQATTRDLRQGHNLERLYRNGEFDG